MKYSLFRGLMAVVFAMLVAVAPSAFADPGATLADTPASMDAIFADMGACAGSDINLADCGDQHGVMPGDRLPCACPSASSLIESSAPFVATITPLSPGGATATIAGEHISGARPDDRLG